MGVNILQFCLMHAKGQGIFIKKIVVIMFLVLKKMYVYVESFVPSHFLCTCSTGSVVKTYTGSFTCILFLHVHVIIVFII